MQNDAQAFNFEYQEEPEYEEEYYQYTEEPNDITMRPNIVIMTVDDLGMGDISWLNKYMQMPNIDALLSESLVLRFA